MKDIINTTDLTPIEIALGVDKDGMTTARNLYKFLELDLSHYNRWFSKNISNNEFAIENEDYIVFAIKGENPNGGRPTKDAKLTADFAKKLSMTAKNEKGEQARNYFVAIEKKAKDTAIMLNNSCEETLLELKEMMIHQSKQITELTSAVMSLCDAVKELITDKKEQQTSSTLSDGSAVTVFEAIDLLNSNGYIINEDELYTVMIENRMIRSTQSKWRLPLKRALANGLLTTRKNTYDVDGLLKTYEETMITPVGLEYLKTVLKVA